MLFKSKMMNPKKLLSFKLILQKRKVIIPSANLISILQLVKAVKNGRNVASFSQKESVKFFP